MLSRVLELIKQRRNRKDLYSTEAYWDSKARLYEDTAVSMWPNPSLNRLYEVEQKDALARHLGDIRGAQVLDLGCGTGRFSRWLATQGALVTGVDFSSGVLSIARRMSAGDNPAYRQASVFDIDDRAAFDLVFVLGVLTVACRTRQELLAALGRIRAALRPGGRMLLIEPIHAGFLHRVLDLGLEGFLATVQEAGFRVEAVSALHFWPARLALSYVAWPAWITSPVYRAGQVAMRLPGLSNLGDYRVVAAMRSGDGTVPPGGTS
jgi:2-polyprenyl-3-methyl-5-hydroxy-6-metoxy-1,4-benzoquinol methylase